MLGQGQVRDPPWQSHCDILGRRGNQFPSQLKLIRPLFNINGLQKVIFIRKGCYFFSFCYQVFLHPLEEASPAHPESRYRLEHPDGSRKTSEMGLFAGSPQTCRWSHIWPWLSCPSAAQHPAGGKSSPATPAEILSWGFSSQPPTINLS